MPRIIMHADLDYFYAQCEVLRKPGLKGKPVVICVYSGRSGDSGAVGTASYEARKLGIKSGIPISAAKSLAEKDKNTAFLPVDMEYYRSVSERVMEILEAHADSFEQVSVDEAYLDVSSSGSFASAAELAEEIKKEISKKESLTCSIGIGPNKLVAKMAAGVNKPDGLFSVEPGDVKDFLSPLHVKELFTVGPKTEEALSKPGIKTIGQLAAFDISKLKELLGEKKAEQLHHFASGIDERPVEQGERQQISKLGTLPENTRELQKISEFIDFLCADLDKRINRSGVAFRNVSFIAIATDLSLSTRSRTLKDFTDSMRTAAEEAKNLAREFLEGNPKIILRRAGIRVADLKKKMVSDNAKKQKSLSDFGR